MIELSSSGDVVERQIYLNGTRYYLIEGEADGGWSWTLALTLPKEESEPLSEGDVTLVAGARAWYGDIASGSHRETIDESVDAPVTELQLELVRRIESESSEPWTAGTATARIAADLCELSLRLA